MKKILAILIVLAVSQICFAQSEAYKLDEIIIAGGNCDVYSRLDNFVEVLKKENSKGLIIIHTDSKSEKFGNVIAYVLGAKRWLKDWMKIPTEQISFVISSGKPQFTQEIWIIPQNAQTPESPKFDFDWRNLNNKYHFSQTCLRCEPSYPLLTSFQPNFEEFANVLKKYPNYKGQIIVNDDWEIAQVKENLTTRLELPRHRYSIQLRKSKKTDEFNGNVDLYLIPNSKNKIAIIR